MATKKGGGGGRGGKVHFGQSGAGALGISASGEVIKAGATVDAKAAAAATAATSAGSTNDSFTNFEAQVGIGTDNILSGSTYSINPITRNRILLEYAYRGSWICRSVIESMADDMTRAGVKIKSSLTPEKIKKLATGAQRLQLMRGFNDLAKWGRLYGGAVALIMISGQSMATPLRLETVGKGQFKGLFVLDRWMVIPDWGSPITDQGPDLGKPEFYEPVPGLPGIPRGKIHHSRVIRYEGVSLPYFQRLTENGWGLSVLEPMWDRLISFDSATMGAAQLVYKAHVRTLKFDGFRKAVAGPADQLKGIIKTIEFLRKYQANEGFSCVDKNDDIETQDYSFAGVPDIIDRMAQQVSGASETPMIRLMGEAPSGLNADGSGVMRAYYDKVESERESRLRDGVTIVMKIMYQSELGTDVPDDFDIDFPSLWQLDDVQKAEIAGYVTTAITTAFEKGVIDRPVALKELKESSETTGIYTNITDEMIEDAEEAPPSPNMLALSPEEIEARAKLVAAESKEAGAGEGGSKLPSLGAKQPPSGPAGDHPTTDPATSGAQERLMQAACHTPGGYGGVPQSVGCEYVGDTVRAAGVIYVEPSGKILYVKRSDRGDHVGEWGLPGGRLLEGESPSDGASRESFEEIGRRPDGNMFRLMKQTSGEGVEYTTFVQSVPTMFIPNLNDEHTDYAWNSLERPPEPIHPGLAQTLKDLMLVVN